MGMKSEAAEEKAVASCMEQAMQSIVDDLFNGEKVDGISLHDVLEDEPHISAAAAQAILAGQLSEVKEEAERLIREWFKHWNALHDRAYEIAHPEES
jgi:hypothetical protein